MPATSAGRRQQRLDLARTAPPAGWRRQPAASRRQSRAATGERSRRQLPGLVGRAVDAHQRDEADLPQQSAAGPPWPAFPARPARRPAPSALRAVSCRTRSKTTLASALSSSASSASMASMITSSSGLLSSLAKRAHRLAALLVEQARPGAAFPAHTARSRSRFSKLVVARCCAADSVLPASVVNATSRPSASAFFQCGSSVLQRLARDEVEILVGRLLGGNHGNLDRLGLGEESWPRGPLRAARADARRRPASCSSASASETRSRQ